MIGRVVGDAGAARRIAVTIIDRLGERGVQWAMTVTSVLIEVTMFYEVAFVIIVPVAFTLVRATGRPLLWVGLPMSITLSTMHSFLPPHPGPTAVAGFYNVSVGLTLAIGLVVALPVGALISWLWPRLSLVRRMSPQIPEGLISDKELTEEQMPGLLPSLSVAPLPVVLIAGAAIYDMTRPADNLLTDVIAFVGSPPVALLACLLVACWVFGPHVGRTLSEVGESMSGGARAMAMILMVIGAGGAFKEVLDAIGMDEYIAEVTRTWTVSPLLLAWLIAVILRIALGSATVAVTTAAGIAAPLVTGSVSPELMVLATTCGSVAFSHVNDPGFWMFKEYFNLSVTEAIKTRTTYTTALSVLGLAGVMLMSVFIHAHTDNLTGSKAEHWATALTTGGRKVLDKALPNDESRLRGLYERLGSHGRVLVAVDQPATIGALAVAVAQAMGTTVGYLPGLSMRRIADLTPGSARTDAKDAAVIAEAARTTPHTLRSISTSDEDAASLSMLTGFDLDLARQDQPDRKPCPGPVHPDPPSP